MLTLRDIDRVLRQGEWPNVLYLNNADFQEASMLFASTGGCRGHDEGGEYLVYGGTFIRPKPGATIRTLDLSDRTIGEGLL